MLSGRRGGEYHPKSLVGRSNYGMTPDDINRYLAEKRRLGGWISMSQLNKLMRQRTRSEIAREQIDSLPRVAPRLTDEENV